MGKLRKKTQEDDKVDFIHDSVLKHFMKKLLESGGMFYHYMQRLGVVGHDKKKGHHVNEFIGQAHLDKLKQVIYKTPYADDSIVNEFRENSIWLGVFRKIEKEMMDRFGKEYIAKLKSNAEYEKLAKQAMSFTQQTPSQ